MRRVLPAWEQRTQSVRAGVTTQSVVTREQRDLSRRSTFGPAPPRSHALRGNARSRRSASSAAGLGTEDAERPGWRYDAERRNEGNEGTRRTERRNERTRGNVTSGECANLFCPSLVLLHNRIADLLDFAGTKSASLGLSKARPPERLGLPASFRSFPRLADGERSTPTS